MIATHLPELAPELDGHGRFGAALAAAIMDQVERHRPEIVSVNGGNAHNALALMRHERPLDFRLSGEPSPPLDPTAECLVEAQVEATLAHHLAPDFTRMRALHALVGSFVHLESPPPLQDDQIILAAADAFFRDGGIAVRGVAPAGLRYRMWRLASRLFRAQAAALGCRFLPVPTAALDAHGFLRPELAADATHGNADYGTLWLEALAA